MSKIDNYLNNCDDECQKKKKLNYLYYKYINYLEKYTSSYNDYLLYKNSSYSEQKNKANNGYQISQQMNNRMRNIQELFRKNLLTIDNEIKSNKTKLVEGEKKLKKITIEYHFLIEKNREYLRDIDSYIEQIKNKKTRDTRKIYVFYIVHIMLMVLLLLFFYLCYKTYRILPL